MRSPLYPKERAELRERMVLMDKADNRKKTRLLLYSKYTERSVTSRNSETQNNCSFYTFGKKETMEMKNEIFLTKK